ncbi:MAG: 6-carboxytetrahydropterin synthase [Oceanococcaceae bacterium]
MITNACASASWLSARALFHAARQLPEAAADDPARHWHGHNFRADVRVPQSAIAEIYPGSAVNDFAAALRNAVEPFDYTRLNDHLATPDDAALLAHICTALPLSDAVISGHLRSRDDSGASRADDGRYLLWRRYQFQAAHRLPYVPAGHKCGRMHGHSFAAVLHVDAPVRHQQIDAAWAPLQEQLHFHCLNDIPGLDNPTSEHLARWIWQQLQERLPGLRWVTVFETGSCGACYDGTRFRIWKDMTLDSATRHTGAPSRDPRGRLHGYTYTLRLHLHADLDAVRGWTVDFGDVKALFAPLFARLDHHRLDALGPDFARGDTTALAQAIGLDAGALLPSLARVDLLATPGCGSLWIRDGQPPALPL